MWNRCSRSRGEVEKGVVSRQTLGLRVAGTVFGIVAAAHALRLATRAKLVIAGWEVPLGINALGVLIAGGLCLWLWRLSRQRVQS
jgi:hypothetical protein